MDGSKWAGLFKSAKKRRDDSDGSSLPAHTIIISEFFCCSKGKYVRILKTPRKVIEDDSFLFTIRLTHWPLACAYGIVSLWNPAPFIRSMRIEPQRRYGCFLAVLGGFAGMLTDVA